MAEGNWKKKPRAKYYSKSKPYHKKYPHASSLQNGMTGFLVTIGGYERKAVAELYSFLERMVEDGVPKKSQGEEESGLPTNSDEDDVLQELEQEIATMKDSHEPSNRQFRSVESGARGVLFVSCSEKVDPCLLAHQIFQKLASTKEQTLRFCVRLIPVSIICPAYAEDIQKKCCHLFEEFHKSSEEVLKYCVVYKARNNNSANKDNIISAMVDMVTMNRQFPHKVDLDNPDRVIIVEIIKNHCCVSVVKDYFLFKKYNLQEVVKDEQPDESCHESD